MAQQNLVGQIFGAIQSLFRTDTARTDNLFDGGRNYGGIQHNPSGLGYAPLDPMASVNVAYPTPISQWEAEAYYAQWPCRRVVDVVPDSMTREWGVVNVAADNEIARDVQNYLDQKLKTPWHFNRAQKYANLYGGAAIVLLVNDGVSDFSKPVNRRGIRSIEAMRVIDGWHIYPDLVGQLYRDPMFPDHYRLGYPLHGYTDLGQVTIKSDHLIHHTRVLRFDGLSVSEDVMRNLNGWSDSVLRDIGDAYRAYQLAIQSVAGATKDFEIFVHKISSLASIIRDPNAKSALTQRAQNNRNMVEVFRTFFLDKDAEDIDYVSRRFNGIEGILEKLKENLTAASGLGPAILEGSFPSGLGATGVSERLQWADKVRNEQEQKFRAPLEQLLKLIFLAKDGPTGGRIPKEWNWEFKNLFQLTDEEKISLRSQQSQIDATYLREGVLLPEEVTQSRFGGSEYSFETVLDKEARQKAEAEKQATASDPFGLTESKEGSPDEPEPESEPEPEPKTDSADKFFPPKSAQRNAQKVLRWKEKHGDQVAGMTRVGWTRARQLASGDPVSLDIVKRMAQFGRHEQNSKLNPEYRNTPWKDAGYVAWLGWGGDTGIRWAKRISSGTGIRTGIRTDIQRGIPTEKALDPHTDR